MGVFSPTLMNRLSCQEYERRKDVKDLPKSVDWRKDGYVSDVKEQVIINNTETPPIWLPQLHFGYWQMNIYKSIKFI